MKICTIKIGKLTISFQCPSKQWEEFLKKHYRPFLISSQSRTKVNIKSLGPAALNKKLRVQSTDNEWTIERSDFVSVSKNSFLKTDLSVERNKYSFDSWLRVFFTLYALKNNGVLLHGAGVVIGSAAYVFPGRSGAGKSSLIRIFGKKSALSDELVYIYKHRNRLYAASTPFWGELEKGCGNVYNAPLKGIHFISHSKSIVCNEISRGKAVSKLLKTVLFFSKDLENMEKVFSFALKAIESVPGYKLGFSLKTKKKEIKDHLIINPFPSGDR